MFRRQGWNLAGANLLAASCHVAQAVFLYVRPRLAARDVSFAVVLALAAGLVFLPLAQAFPLVSLAAGVLAGGFYLLWKAGSWRPAHEIIRASLDRKMQSRLVGELVAVCQANHIDPEDLDNLASQLRDEEQGGSSGPKQIVSQFHSSILHFFHVQLKMQE